MISRETIIEALDEAEQKAWEALYRYKFWMFGYYASRWVFLARLWRQETNERLANPFRPLTEAARKHLKEETDDVPGNKG